jgi:hypothetical protein
VTHKRPGPGSCLIDLTSPPRRFRLIVEIFESFAHIPFRGATVASSLRPTAIAGCLGLLSFRSRLTEPHPPASISPRAASKISALHHRNLRNLRSLRNLRRSPASCRPPRLYPETRSWGSVTTASHNATPRPLPSLSWADPCTGISCDTRQPTLPTARLGHRGNAAWWWEGMHLWTILSRAQHGYNRAWLQTAASNSGGSCTGRRPASRSRSSGRRSFVRCRRGRRWLPVKLFFRLPRSPLSTHRGSPIPASFDSRRFSVDAFAGESHLRGSA